MADKKNLEAIYKTLLKEGMAPLENVAHYESDYSPSIQGNRVYIDNSEGAIVGLSYWASKALLKDHILLTTFWTWDVRKFLEILEG